MALSLDIENIGKTIQTAKQTLRAQGADLKAAFNAMSASIQAEIAGINQLRAQGQSPIPELAFADVQAGLISDAEKALIRKRGCVVIRQTFPAALASDWNERIKHYVDENAYFDTPDKGLDKYFSSLQQGKPQILSLYWSKPQIEARQHEHLAGARRFLNRLWDYEPAGEVIFDPDRECTYADRIRHREPGDNSLGLRAHIDGGSVERWLDQDGFQQVFRHLIQGDWERYDPFAARYRPQTSEIPSPAVCSMFRTYQGWTALTPQGPGDGTLQLIPSARVLGWMFLRALQDDVPDDDLCGAMPGRALQCTPEWHQPVLEGLCSIPPMQPGDTVWWHPDVVHAVEDEHRGEHYSNVIYIGAAPYCDKNTAYLERQAPCFIGGMSSPDFAAENYEVDYAGRATVEDLSELGKQQMGLGSTCIHSTQTRDFYR